MAENAAHFTTTWDPKPTIFEIIAQRSLNSTLHPAVQKIALFLASISPNRCNWLYEYYDEVFLCFNGLLQYYYLRTSDASFSECFYGLKRVPLNTHRLLKSHRHLSFIFLVLLPYVKHKVENRLQIYRIENAEGTLGNDAKGISKKALLTCFSSYQLIINIWTVMQYLQYMSGKTEYQTPALRLPNLKLIYSMDTQDQIGFWTSLFRGQLSLAEISKGIIQNTLQSTLELSAFFVQFLQAWNAERQNYNFSALPQIDPPPFEDKANSFQGKCPLCRQRWKIPTLLPISGYVYCFPCIIKYLREHQMCPVTKLPSKALDIVRLYDGN